MVGELLLAAGSRIALWDMHFETLFIQEVTWQLALSNRHGRESHILKTFYHIACLDLIVRHASSRLMAS